jgi:hypothetical protein
MFPVGGVHVTVLRQERLGFLQVFLKDRIAVGEMKLARLFVYIIKVPGKEAHAKLHRTYSCMSLLPDVGGAV